MDLIRRFIRLPFSLHLDCCVGFADDKCNVLFYFLHNNKIIPSIRLAKCAYKSLSISNYNCWWNLNFQKVTFKLFLFYCSSSNSIQDIQTESGHFRRTFHSKFKNISNVERKLSFFFLLSLIELKMFEFVIITLYYSVFVCECIYVHRIKPFRIHEQMTVCIKWISFSMHNV